MSESVKGQATAAGTAAVRARAAGGADWRRLGERWLSTIGLGTYLGSDDDVTDGLYREAVGRALERGVNVLDSAINYRSQRSERAVGAALRDAIARGAVKREEILITTKGGFLPFDGARPRNLHAYVEENYFRTGILKREEFVAGCHSMAPRYLQDQLERSRKNLGVDVIDVYYLHNPETQLDELPREEFLRRMRAAFEALEQACTDGKIGMYGTATWNGYRQPDGANDRLDLGELVAIAREVGGVDHRFRMIQLPYNLAMPEAAALANQRRRGEAAPLLDAAADEGIYIMTSGSILQGKLARQLPDELRARLGAGLATDAQRALQFVRSTPGVGTALVGMKRAAHVDENLALASVPLLDAHVIDELLHDSVRR